MNKRRAVWYAGLGAVFLILGAAAWLLLPPRTGTVTIEVCGPAGTKFLGWYEVDRNRHYLAGATPATFPIEGDIVVFSIAAVEGSGDFSVKVHVDGRAPGSVSGKLPMGVHGWVQWRRSSPSFWIESFDPKRPEKWRSPLP